MKWGWSAQESLTKFSFSLCVTGSGEAPGPKEEGEKVHWDGDSLKKKFSLGLIGVLDMFCEGK